MAKRKETDTTLSTPTKRVKKDNGQSTSKSTSHGTVEVGSPSKGHRTNGAVTPNKNRHNSIEDVGEDTETTPRPNGTSLFATPRRRGRPPKGTPSRNAKADLSAKRKSAQALAETYDTEAWDNSTALAEEILADEDLIETTEQDTVTVNSSTVPLTPSKRGRPKGAKNKRSPTPEGDLAPEERYFFQNRTGPARVSSNVFSSVGLLNHDDYFKCMRGKQPDHGREKAYLTKLHTRSFPQWKFELDRGFSVCMYGYGSKKRLVTKFAEWLYPKLGEQPRIVVLNGYTPRINIRNMLNIIGSALVAEDEELRMTGQPHEMVDTILTHLTHHVKGNLIMLINSIDSTSLRKSMVQSVLARLASHPNIQVVATADTPTFPILWSSTLKNQFHFVYHDCTTFAPYEMETNPVDDVNELLGRKNRRTGGKEGIGFVLKSLPENARNLYGVLLTEILSVVNDGTDHFGDDDEGERPIRSGAGETAEEIGVEYRALYQKALEEFICSSDMNFRFLLKEFHDHQMLTSRRDASGTELLGVPLSREEMEAVLEDLVIG